MSWHRSTSLPSADSRLGSQRVDPDLIRITGKFPRAKINWTVSSFTRHGGVPQHSPHLFLITDNLPSTPSASFISPQLLCASRDVCSTERSVHPWKAL